MTPDEAIKDARSDLRPVYLVVGEERLLVDRVVTALRDRTAERGIAGFNDDKFTAGETSVDAVIGAARMMPMMAEKRLVLVRGLERWEKKDDEDDAPKPAKKGKIIEPPLDVLAEYAKNPVPSTVMVLVATKLHGQRRLVTTAKKGGFLVTCEQLSRRALPAWIQGAAREKGHPMDDDVAELLAEMAGPELGYVADAVERLSLFVGDKQPITEAAVAELVTPVRQGTVWELVDALGRRKLDRVLAALADVFDERDGGLRVLGAIGWSIRQMVKFDAALKGGANIAEAAQRAGVAPFKANEVAGAVRSIPAGTLESWLLLLAEADVALKSSRRPGRAILETMLIGMCA